MQITFGKYDGKDSRAVLIKDPSYVAWCCAQPGPKGALGALVNALKVHVAIFDAAPFTEPCLGRRLTQKCQNTAVKGTAYVGSSSTLAPDLYWWCDTCDPYNMGAVKGRLREVRTYNEALRLVGMYGGLKADYIAIIGDMAAAKGLGRLTQKNLDAFFGP